MKREELEKLDVKEYIGTKTEIVSATIEKLKHGYVLKLQSAPIEFKEGDTLPEGKMLSASKILGFNQHTNGEHYIGIDSKLDKWLNENKFDTKIIPDELMIGARIKEIEGLKVTVQANDRGYLEIA